MQAEYQTKIMQAEYQTKIMQAEISDRDNRIINVFTGGIVAC